MQWKTEEDIPSRHQDHVVFQILALDFGLLHDDDICAQDVEHCLPTINILNVKDEAGNNLESPLISPWLICKGIPGCG